MKNLGNSQYRPAARANLIALSLVGLLTLSLLLVIGAPVSSTDSEKSATQLRTVKFEGDLPTIPMDKYSCFLKSYHNGNPWFAWLIPDAYGNDFYNMRFTVDDPSDVCTLKTAYVLMYADVMTGTPDMQIILWADDGAGFPGAQLDQVTIPYSTLPTTGINWVQASWNSVWTFTQGQDYHIGWTILPSGPGDTLACISDDALGPHSNTGEYRASEYWNGAWGTMLDDWGIDVCFMIESELCCGDYPQPLGPGEIIIDQIDGSPSLGQVYADTPLKFYFRARNWGWSKVADFSSGFRVYSPDGASFDNIYMDSLSIGWYNRFDLTGFMTSHSYGASEDSAWVGAVSMMGNGFEPGFDDQVWTIETQVSSSGGDTLCIDSAFFPPSYNWIWHWSVEGSLPPSWGGPYCYEIVSCCIERGDIDHGGTGIDISDLVYLVDYMFNGGPEPPCLDEADITGAGGIDISDLVYLVDYMFNGGPPPVPCS